MPGARRTARPVLAVGVTVSALLREVPAGGCGPADLVAAPSPEGSRPSGLGMPPAPESALCPPTSPARAKLPRQLAHPSRWSRVPRQSVAGAGRAWRAEGVPLMTVKKVLAPHGPARAQDRVSPSDAVIGPSSLLPRSWSHAPRPARTGRRRSRSRRTGGRRDRTEDSSASLRHCL
jgi:hypothetical protein